MVIAGQPVRFQARVDLVVSHPDGEIEQVDFKTGAPHEDAWIQRDMERLVVGTAHSAARRNGTPLRTTTLYATAAEADSLCISRESLRQTRAGLVALTSQMLTTANPAPIPAALCAWSPSATPAARSLWPYLASAGAPPFLMQCSAIGATPCVRLLAGNVRQSCTGKEVCSHRGELPSGTADGPIQRRHDGRAR